MTSQTNTQVEVLDVANVIVNLSLSQHKGDVELDILKNCLETAVSLLGDNKVALAIVAQAALNTLVSEEVDVVEVDCEEDALQLTAFVKDNAPVANPT